MGLEGDELREDPLSVQARAQHRNLLVAASVAVLFVVLDPQHISTLGIEIESSKRGWILAILFVAIAYFEASFLASARGDFLIWRNQVRDQERHLDAVLRAGTPPESAIAQLDQNLADGESPEEIDRRRQELIKTSQAQIESHARLLPLVRFLRLRGWVDFYLAPTYGLAAAMLVVFEFARQL